MVEMLWVKEAHGADLATPERRAGLEQALRRMVATIGNADVRRHYETAIREQTQRHFGAQKPFRRARGSFAGRGKWPTEPTGPSASLLSSRLVRERAHGAAAGPTLSDSVLLGALILHPEIAAERLESLADTHFSGAAASVLGDALASKLADNPQIDADRLVAALETAGHGKTVAAVLEQLKRAGLGRLAESDTARAAAIWDDAHHLRLSAGTLSIERQAAAAALGRETSDIHLSRLRDIQEQVSRTLHPASEGDAGDTVIVHPFKAR
jgi:DNA primase